jgi:hypothetical protein
LGLTKVVVFYEYDKSGPKDGHYLGKIVIVEFLGGT